MEKLIRSFIAIPLTEQIHQHLADFCRQQGLDNRIYGLKPVKPANIHLTLKFLGEIDQSRVAKLSTALDQVAARLTPFSISINGIGAFPAWHRNPRVIWVSASPAEPLREVFFRVENATVGLDFPPEAKEFSPHLTLARIGTHSDQLNGLVKKLAQLTPEPGFGEMMVTRLVLFRSVLLPQGPVYTALSNHLFSE